MRRIAVIVLALALAVPALSVTVAEPAAAGCWNKGFCL